MSNVIVDASLALAWSFPDEGNAYADTVLQQLEGHTIVVLAIWPIEIANALWVGERRKRIQEEQIYRFFSLIEGLSIILDTQNLTITVKSILPLAREYNLSAYIAAYLELAIHYNLPISTLDKRLRNAAQMVGLLIFESRD